MLTVKKAYVPLFLREGAFYHSLSDGDDEDFSIPAEFFMSDAEAAAAINDEKTLRTLLSTLRFWCVERLPASVYSTFFSTKYSDFRSLFAEFRDQLRPLEVLDRIRALHSDLQLDCAALSGDLELVKCLHSNGGRIITNDCIRSAAERGHLHCLEYFHSTGFNWDREAVCDYAALHGHLNCLKYAVEHGARLNRCNAAKRAALRGREDILRYIETTQEYQIQTAL